MKLLSTIVLSAAALIACTAAGSTQTATVTGTWVLEPNGPDHRPQITLSSDGELHTMHWQETLRMDAPPGQANFDLRREAGNFHFTGTLANGRGGGEFTFTPNDPFIRGLAARGLHASNAHGIMTAAAVDETLEYIDRIHASGYPQLSFDDLLAFRALDVTPASIAELRSLFGSVSADDVISTSALHVTRAYVNELHAMGISTVTPERAVTFKSLHITKAYVDELARLGFRNLSPDNVVTFKAMHIDAAYLRHLQQHGLKNLSAEQVIEMKAAGL